MEWLQPLHPKLVHFPVALFSVAVLFEWIGLVFKKELFHSSAFISYITATVFTPFVVWAGLQQKNVLQIKHPLLDKHELLGTWLLWVSLISLPVLWLLFKKSPRWGRVVFNLLLIASAVCVAVGAHYGGAMVYEYGVGTDVF